jgi:hypothetical protein
MKGLLGVGPVVFLGVAYLRRSKPLAKRALDSRLAENEEPEFCQDVTRRTRRRFLSVVVAIEPVFAQPCREFAHLPGEPVRSHNHRMEVIFVICRPVVHVSGDCDGLVDAFRQRERHKERARAAARAAVDCGFHLNAASEKLIAI